MFISHNFFKDILQLVADVLDYATREKTELQALHSYKSLSNVGGPFRVKLWWVGPKSHTLVGAGYQNQALVELLTIIRGKILTP